MNNLILQMGHSRSVMSFIVVMGIIIGYLNYSQTSEPVIIENVGIQSKDAIDSFENFNLNFSILENETYQLLEIFGESPVSPGFTGENKDPFTPI